MPIPAASPSAHDLAEAYRKALLCDPVSAYGGIVAVNRALDEESAAAITGIFTEVVIAPDADEAALAVFAKKANLRLLLTGGMADPDARPLRIRSVAGGFLAQERDAARVTRADCRVVTKRAPSEAEFSDLLFAFRVAKHVKSNAIVYAKEGATVGIGAGQMSRVDSARIAAIKAADAAKAAGLERPLTEGSVVASDAFFPFADGLARGGGSRRDGGHPAGRVAPRRRGDRRRRRSRPRHGLFRRPAFPALGRLPHIPFGWSRLTRLPSVSVKET